MNNKLFIFACVISIKVAIWMVYHKQKETIDELKQINKKLDSFVEWTGVNEPIR